VRRKGRGKMAGRGGNRGCAGPGEAEEKKKKGRGWGEADRWSRFVSVRGNKIKKEEEDGPLREGVGGPLG
jgi:hypothetical protein